MADEADERSALLQNGHATAEPEVGFGLFSTFTIRRLPLLACGYSRMPIRLTAKLAGRIYRKRQRESEELVTN